MPQKALVINFGGSMFQTATFDEIKTRKIIDVKRTALGGRLYALLLQGGGTSTGS